MKILILGHGRHGKDTFAHFIAAATGLRFSSSSVYCAEKLIFSKLKNKYNYGTVADCYNDRATKREEWYNIIREYNTPDKSRLARAILSEYDIYVGMRSDQEYQASKHLFDKIAFVDAYQRLEDEDTMKIGFNRREMIYIDNNGNLHDLLSKALNFVHDILPGRDSQTTKEHNGQKDISYTCSKS